MSMLDALGSKDERPYRKGWAPGDYTNKCDCGKHFMGGKRASECADCAYSKPIRSLLEPRKICPYRAELTAIKRLVKDLKQLTYRG